MNRKGIPILVQRLIRLLGLCKNYFPENSEEEFMTVARTLLRVIDSIDHYTYSHSLRVATYAEQLADEINLSTADKKSLRHGALLHDVGKISVGKKILCKNGPLTDEEWLIVKRHPLIGAELLEDSGHFSHIIPMVKHHHESFDGNGYPEGLAGERIPFQARILAIADSFDAITTNRPYSPDRSVSEALKEIKRCSGSQFDPVMVDAFTGAIELRFKHN
ncbi:MAG: HD-GYP domain-containing protein [Syntrophomonas sp.]